MTPPTTIEARVTRSSRSSFAIARERPRTASDPHHELLSDVSHEMGEAAALERTASSTTSGRACGDARNAREGLRLVRREWRRHRAFRPHVPRRRRRWLAVEIKRVATIDAVEQLTAISSASGSTRRCRNAPASWPPSSSSRRPSSSPRRGGSGASRSTSRCYEVSESPSSPSSRRLEDYDTATAAANNSCSRSRPLRRYRPRESNVSPAAPSARSRVVPDTSTSPEPASARMRLAAWTAKPGHLRRTVPLAAGECRRGWTRIAARASTSSSPLRIARSAPSNTIKRIPRGLDLPPPSGPHRADDVFVHRRSALPGRVALRLRVDRGVDDVGKKDGGHHACVVARLRVEPGAPSPVDHHELLVALHPGDVAG